MKKNGTINLIVIIVTALVMLAIMTFTLGSLETTGSSWFVQPAFNEATGEYVGESVILENSDTATKIYVRIGNVYNADKDGNIKFTVDGSSSKTEICKYGTYLELTRSRYTIKPQTERGFEAGWYLLGENLSLSYNYLRFTTEQSFDFEEIVFFDKDNKQIESSCIGGFVERKFKSAEDYSAVAAVCDGQKSFAFDSMHMLNAKEESLIGSAKNLYSYEGYFVSDKVTPFGTIICGLGTLIFGNSAFGVRFVAFLFSFATLISVYFFAKKLLGCAFYGIFAEIVWFLCGMGISLSGVGYTVSVALFFVIWAYYFAYAFYTDDSAPYSLNRYRNLYLSGFAVALGGAIDVFAFAALPAVILFYLLSVIKTSRGVAKQYKTASGLEKEFLREKYVKTLTYSITGLVVALAIVPFVILLTTYGIFSPIYKDYYSAGNVFAAMFSNLSEIVSGNNGSFVIGWLAGLGSETQSGIFARVISANKALVVCSFVLFILYAVLYCMNRKNKANQPLSDAIAADKATGFVFVAFALTFISNIFGGFFADYSCFAYSLIFLVLALPCSYKLYNKNINRMAFGFSFSACIVVISVFFLLSSVCFLGIDIPEKVARYLYGWTL